MGVKQFLIALDQLGNTLLGGYADETISSRCHRMETRSKAWARARVVVDLLFGRGHCAQAYESEMLRRQSPVEHRGPCESQPTP